MDRKKKQSLFGTFRRFMNICLDAEGPGALHKIVDEEIFGFGTALDEKIFGIKEVRKLLNIQKKQSRGLTIKWKIKPVSRFITTDEHTAVFADDLYLSIRAGKETVKMYIRFSVMLYCSNDQWKVIHWHSSKPEQVESEKDTWGVQNWKQKAVELERQVDEKTADLLKKNRELEIEAALEKVRSRSLAMQKSDDLQEVVHTVFEKLNELKVELYTAILFIFQEGSRDIIWWLENKASQQYAKILVPYAGNQYLKDVIQAKESGKDFFSATYSFEEKNELFHHLFQNTDFKYVPDKQKQFLLESELATMSVALAKNTGINITSYTKKSFSEQENDILKRFGKVFDQAYTRFLDLQKAEAQARAAKIEAALERVRAKAMAMQNSDELGDLVTRLFDELTKLDMVLARCIIWVFNNNDFSSKIWMANSEDKKSATSYYIKALQHPYYEAIIQGWQQRVHKWVYVLEGSEKKSIDDLLLNETELAGLPDPVKNGIRSSEHTIVSGSFNNFGLIEASGPFALSDEQMEILSRFAKVFDLSYTRFNDLQQAEAQAREARIEAALERVRSKTMAMHNSQDVTSATETMFEELKKLGIDNLRCGIANIHPNKTFDVFGVTNLEGGNKMSGFGLFGMDEHPVWQRWFESWKNKEEVFIAFLTGQEKEEYFNNINNHRNYLPQKIVQFPDNYFQAYYFEQGSVWAYSLSKHSEPEKEIMKRFATGFSLTFRRYQDLKQSEARAREAKIEAALERVRARAMAMHKSDDLEMAVATVFEELDKLNLGLIRCGIAILDKEKPRGDIWITIKSERGNTLQVSGDEPLDIHPLLQGAYDAWKKREDFSYVLKGQDLAKYYQAITKTNFQQPISTSFHAEKTDEQQYYFNAVFQDGSLFAFLNAGFTDEAKMVMKRFANVFDLTYKRFLDLQKAEAQAREAKIEAALERVRANAMAMHNSKDLAATIGVFYRELQNFSITPRRCGVGLLNKENRTAELSTMNTTEQGDSVEIIGTLKMQGHPVLEAVYDNWLQQKEYHPVLRGNEIKEYYGLLRPQIEFPDYPNDAVQYGYFFFFSEGGVYAWTEKEMSEDELQIYRRFTTVLSLTYKRYIDLKQAEANAKEAIKQAALDRIRADIASMRTVSDLDRITPLVWNELTILGIPFIRCGVFIMDEPQQLIHTFLSTPDGKAIAAFHLPYDTPGNIGHVLRHWRNNQDYIDHWDESSFKELAGMLVQQKAIEFPEQYLKTIPPGGFFLHFLPFLQGMLYVGNTFQLEEEQIKLIQSVADAFSTAYARYEDFNKLEAAKQQVEKTLVDLKQAQTQLVQSEKMASLGELTAGIAHEIQNPLNFVNNFSDVSNELLGEMKTELEKGNIADAITIAEDVKQNLEKILHHGKRADGIVKGMLQHSRTSSGQKELININTLADEYMRLAYHGLRAKDKTFNAKFETDFDSSLEKINVIPQDIGRVILNLINNAFYAVSEKKKQSLDGYQPTVKLTTKKSGDRVLIIVRDNGNGITPKMLEKIFQPFFTTKPTGQGTGLGLSLSYDIVKAHGGELNVHTKEGEETEFVIQLPFA